MINICKINSDNSFYKSNGEGYPCGMLIKCRKACGKINNFNPLFTSYLLVTGTLTYKVIHEIYNNWVSYIFINPLICVIM